MFKPGNAVYALLARIPEGGAMLAQYSVTHGAFGPPNLAARAQPKAKITTSDAHGLLRDTP
ncbi:hypothetical protein B6E78_05975 [Edwardsiella ictaluri]|nr:hypothetical protein B6E78_05975 [Edwardsiella ictaluri]